MLMFLKIMYWGGKWCKNWTRTQQHLKKHAKTTVRRSLSESESQQGICETSDETQRTTTKLMAVNSR